MMFNICDLLLSSALIINLVFICDLISSGLSVMIGSVELISDLRTRP